MKVTYDLSENEIEDHLFCGQCGTFLWDTAELNTETRTVQIHIASCFGGSNETHTLQEFLDEYGSQNHFWPDEPFNFLLNDVKELL